MGPHDLGSGAAETKQRRLGLAIVALLLALVSTTTVLAERSTSPQQQPAPPAKAMMRDEVIRKATADAQGKLSERELVEVRVDEVVAESITLDEADRRLGIKRGPSGYRSGQNGNSPVWWVTARGVFRTRGRERDGQPAPLLTATERILVYDAATGQLIGLRLPTGQ